MSLATTNDSVARKLTALPCVKEPGIAGAFAGGCRQFKEKPDMLGQSISGSHWFDITEATRLWVDGFDTLDISKALGVPEPVVYKWLPFIKFEAKALRALKTLDNPAHHSTDGLHASSSPTGPAASFSPSISPPLSQINNLTHPTNSVTRSISQDERSGVGFHESGKVFHVGNS